MRLRQALVALVLVATVVATVAPDVRAERLRVAAPDLTWSELRPYVHANVVPHRDADGFFVLVCTGATEPEALPDGFDPQASDFVKVLLLERVWRDPSFRAAIGRVAESVRRRFQASPDQELDRYRALFWRELDRQPQVMRRLEADVVRARRRGWVRCRACESDPEFRPAGLLAVGER